MAKAAEKPVTEAATAAPAPTAEAASEPSTGTAVAVRSLGTAPTVTDADGIIQETGLRAGTKAIIGGRVYEAEEAVTKAVIVLGVSSEVYFNIQIIGKFTESQEEMKGTRKSDGTGGSFSGKPFLLDVIDLDDGNEKQIVAPAVFMSEITKKFPNDSYVGLYFACRKHSKVGRAYHTFDIRKIKPVTVTA